MILRSYFYKSSKLNHSEIIDQLKQGIMKKYIAPQYNVTPATLWHWIKKNRLFTLELVKYVKIVKAKRIPELIHYAIVILSEKTTQNEMDQ